MPLSIRGRWVPQMSHVSSALNWIHLGCTVWQPGWWEEMLCSKGNWDIWITAKHSKALRNHSCICTYPAPALSPLPPPLSPSLLAFIFCCPPCLLHALDELPHLLVCQRGSSTIGLLRNSNSTASLPVVSLPLPPCPLLLSPPSALCHTGLFCQ